MDLNEVCESLLDNADMSINLSDFPKVSLNILVHGTVKDKFWKVIFECGQVVHIEAEFDDDSSVNDLFVVLEASVTEKIKSKVAPAVQQRMDGLKDEDAVWKVHLYGDMSLTMFTTKFNWQLVELSAKEYEAAYA